MQLSIAAWSARLVLIQLSDVADLIVRWQQARMLVGRKQISRRTFLAATGGALAASHMALSSNSMPASLDHIILGCNDLKHGISFVEQHTGTSAKFAGVHPGRGTRNALMALGGRRYLEILAPDPEQKTESSYGELKTMSKPTLLGWAVHPDSMDALAQHLRDVGIAFSGPTAGSRQRPDGKLLRWRTVGLNDDRHGLLPFFIEWDAGSVHPSIDAPAGCHLTDFKAGGPNQEELKKMFVLLNLDITVERNANPQLIARIQGPKGECEFHS